MPATDHVDTRYDVLVIGGGPAGENAADIASRSGLRVAVIEHELVGGECTYWACMPSKALLRPGEALDAVRRVPGASAAVTGEMDIDAALARRDAMASNWDDDGQVEWLESVGVDLIRGHGRISGERTVTVQSGDARSTFEARRAVVIATGSTSSAPPIDGLDVTQTWDSRDVTTAKDVPRRLLIIGGGVVGVEMAQAWKWLGAEEVTLVELENQLLSGEERFAGELVQAALEQLGVVVHLGAETKSVTRPAADAPASIEVALSDGTVDVIEADEVLVAAGRSPNTSDLGLDSVRLEPGQAIEVDDHLLATGVPGGWLYAVGDVNERSLLTHTGKYQARIAGAHIGGLDTSAWGDTKATPRVVFTRPEVAAVGLTEEEARDRSIDVRVAEYEMRKLAATSVLGKGYDGRAKLVVDVERDVIVGATFVGPRAGELLHAATIAIIGEVPLERLWHAVPSFPTLSEVWLRLLETYRDENERQFR